MAHQYTLSKSAFIRGIQCYKSLYLKKHHPELEDKISESQQMVFDKGTNIGLLAQKLFPGGVDLGVYIPTDFEKAFTETEQLLEKGQNVIYEAGFRHDNLLCYMDILVKKNGKYYAYEVKGSSSLKPVYLWDTAFQYHVITSSGITLEDISVVYLNNQYVRHGNLDLQQLFIIESVKDRILPLQPKVKTQIQEMLNMLAQPDVPEIDIGLHCSDPYPCSFTGYCWKNIPDYSVFNLSKLWSRKKFELYQKGILEITDVPDDYPLNLGQRLQVKAEKTGKPHINKVEIKKFVNSLHYPLYFLDFESFQSAIPLFDNSKPYQQTVFQYSLHILGKLGGNLQHKEFLAEPKGDPRIPFIQQLVKDLGTTGDIIVYNKTFETTRLKEIAEVFPQYETKVQAINDRVVDLMLPFSKKHYHTPEMNGSYSIKKVLPALVPQFSYNKLDINNGMAASMSYENLYYETDPSVIDKTKKDLLEYCGLDTLAMVEILKVLEKV
jgi:hypothetical protein